MARFTNPIGESSNTGDFEFSESTMSTFDDMSLLVTGVPGEMTLSAYAGITLQYHENYGVFLRDNTVPTNKVATIGDIGGETTTFTTELIASSIDASFSSYPFVAEYVKTNKLVHFSITIDFATATNFGQGSYFLAVPFQSAQNYIFRNGNLIQSGQFFEVSASLVAGQNYMGLFYSKRDTDDVIRNFPLTSTDPFTLSTSSVLYISGSYIATS